MRTEGVETESRTKEETHLEPPARDILTRDLVPSPHNLLSPPTPRSLPLSLKLRQAIKSPTQLTDPNEGRPVDGKEMRGDLERVQALRVVRGGELGDDASRRLLEALPSWTVRTVDELTSRVDS